MKIITLNVWGGRLTDRLIAFVRERTDVDVFCLQEVYHDAVGKDTIWVDQGPNLDMLGDLTAALPDYQVLYHPHLEDWWGLAMFVKKDVPVIEAGEHFVHLHKRHNLDIEVLGHTAKNIQYATLNNGGTPLTVMNFHGLWNGEGKNDSDARIVQSENIISFAKKTPHDYLFCGDFNLSPETKSLRMVEQELGLRNLIKEFGITSTRTPLYTKENKYADYMFVTPTLEVADFKVLVDEVSDHTPLYVEVFKQLGAV